MIATEAMRAILFAIWTICDPLICRPAHLMTLLIVVDLLAMPSQSMILPQTAQDFGHLKKRWSTIMEHNE